METTIRDSAILMIGCGKMGGALLQRWQDAGGRFTVVDPALAEAPAGARLVRDIQALGEERFDCLVVAIKPQLVDEILPAYAAHLAPGGYALSIAAGCTTARLSALLDGAPVVRAMPNLAVALGKGVSGLFAGPGADGAALTHAQALMAPTGTVVTLADEDAIDRVTAVSGSGPGFVFEIARAYVAAAEALGFAPDEARAMVLGTIGGAVALAEAEPATSLSEWRDSVTSKGGTTAAGLAALNGDDELSRRLEATLGAAYDRAVELR